MSGIGPVLQDFLQDGRVLQKRIPHLEAPHVEIEAPAHCLIHAGDTIGDLWRPILGPRIVSTSPTVYPSSSARCSVDIELYTPMRLAIKLGVSLHSTTPLPSTSVANCCMYCTSSGSVSTPGTISSRRM